MIGQFIDKGWAFEIKGKPELPWSNVLTNGKFGSIWTEKGGAFAWCGNSVLDRLTLWHQDLVLNPSKRSIYLADKNGIIRTLTPSPIPGDAEWTVIHGIGWTSYIGIDENLETRLDVVVHPSLNAETWYAQASFKKEIPEEVRFCSFQDIMMGTWSEAHREFHRVFFDISIARESILLFSKKLDTRPGDEEHWNTPYPGILACTCSRVPDGYYADRFEFYGYGGTVENPEALKNKPFKGQLNPWGDPMAGLDVVIKPFDGNAEVSFVTALGRDEEAAMKTAVQALKISRDDAVESAKTFWKEQFGDLEINTPMEEINVSSLWLRYQAISSRILGRCSLYQASGAFGYRDQLQDSLLYLSSTPDKTLSQLELHLRHQYRDGSVLHWWHPETETGKLMMCSDDYLWPILAAAEYYHETGRVDFLEKSIPYLDGGEDTIWNHLKLSVERAWKLRSNRGAPLLGECDWNDGLSSAGDKGKGESFWIAHFLHLLLRHMSEIACAKNEDGTEFLSKASVLRELVNTHGWDGEWYLQGTNDEGDLIGSSINEEGKIHLNPQTWSIISGTASGKFEGRAEIAMNAVLKHLHQPWGTLLLAPAYTKPDVKIGYITRYAPGRRENGGVYTHAAVWSGRAARILKKPNLVQDFLLSLLPPVRGKDPGYKAEPYVTPGNIDGPITSTPGKGGWTWYSGSAAWLFRCILEDLLGIRTEADGLIIEPNVPADWDGFSVSRPFRGKVLKIKCQKGEIPEIYINIPGTSEKRIIKGTKIPSDLIASIDGKEIGISASYVV
jgi:cellobiose phosphorylase